MYDKPDVATVKKRSLRGGGITLVSQAATVALQLVSTVVLARMLTPDDYGVLGMVLSFVALAALFKDLGLSSAAIQKADLTVAQQSNLFWINTLFGLLLTLVFAASAPLVAWFYQRPELLGMTWALSLTFVLGGLSAQHNAMMVRHMQFGRQAIVNIAGVAVTFAVSVGLAYLGYGFWALGWGHVSGAAARTLLIWAFSPFLPGGWKRGVGTMGMIRFGANVTGFNFVNYFSRNLDNILIGKFVGADALGVYGRAYHLMLFPIQNLRGPIDAVTYPALCRLQDQPDEWRKYHMQTLRVLAFLTMPLVAWMYLVSEPLILWLLGENWAEVVPLFQILAIVAFIQPTASMVGSVLLSVGRSTSYFRLGMANAMVYSAGFAVGLNWGPQGVAWSFAVTTYLVLVPSLLFTYSGTKLRLQDFFSATAFPAVGSLFPMLFALTVGKLAVLSSVLDSSRFAELVGKSALYGLCLAAVVVFTPAGRSAYRDAHGILQHRWKAVP